MTAAEFVKLSTEFEAHFKRVEEALDKHAQLVDAYAEHAALRSPKLEVTRTGWSCSVLVKVRNDRRKKPTRISADGLTPTAAVDKLIEDLDIWAKVLIK